MGIPESRGWKKIEKKLREILGTLPKLLHCVVLALSTLSTGAYNSIMVMITVNGITNLNEDRKGVETSRTDGLMDRQCRRLVIWAQVGNFMRFTRFGQIEVALLCALGLASG